MGFGVWGMCLLGGMIIRALGGVEMYLVLVQVMLDRVGVGEKAEVYSISNVGCCHVSRRLVGDMYIIEAMSTWLLV
jgi:hypothetical protein